MLQTLETKDFFALRGYMAGIENFFYGENFCVSFDTKGFQLQSSDLSVSEVVLAAYPKSQPVSAVVTICSFSEMIKDVNGCLQLPASTFAARDLANSIERRVRDQFWRHLEQCIDFQRGTIWNYGSAVGLPGYYTFWQFAYIIHSLAQHRCVIIYGAASD